jgi:hypothetical protein
MSETLNAAARYRRYADARRRILTAAWNRVPLASIAQQARALTIWDGKRVVPGMEEQLAAAFDLGMLDPLGDHGRGIDRQAKAEPPPPDSDEARMLAALQATRFDLYRLLGRGAEGGAAVERLADRAPLTIWDSYLAERTAAGMVFSARLAWPEPDLALTCGIIVAVDSRVLERLLRSTPPQRGPVIPSKVAPGDAAAIEELLDEPAARMKLETLPQIPGFAALVYRTAIDLGLMGPIPGRTPPEAMPRG